MAVSDQIQLLRFKLQLFLHHPELLRDEILNNHQNLLKLLAVLVILLFLLLALFKPAGTHHSPKKKEKMPAEPVEAATLPKIETPEAKDTEIRIIKSYSEAAPLGEEKPKQPVKHFVPMELTEEEELALSNAINQAGRQVLDETAGAPHQAEFKFHQEDISFDAAKKMLGGNIHTSLDTGDEPVISGNQDLGAGFILIYVMAKRGARFGAERLFATLREEGLALNDYHVFEYYHHGVCFFVSSSIKPGTFDVHLLNYSTPGVNFILDLSKVNNGEAAFAKMLKTVHSFAQKMNADILDEHRERLTHMALSEYMARVKSFRR